MDVGCDNTMTAAPPLGVEVPDEQGAAATGSEASAARRRRGAALEDAIKQAAYDELSEVGYAQFSVEAVAERARTGKASIYRRWPTKQALVLDAVCERMPTPEECGLVLDLGESVTTAEALRGVARTIAGVLNSPTGCVMRAIKCEAFTDPELAREIDNRFQAPRRAALLALLERGVARGEVRPEAVTPMVADVMPAVLAHRIILMREEITETDLTEIVDLIVLPLISAPAPA
jgi:AcrR family transcriptional regulator